jgi:hypothetical protein
MRRIGMAVLGLAVLTSAPLFGQRAALREVNERERAQFGFNFTVGQPQGEFRRTGNIAPGFSGFGVLGLPLGLRIDGGWMNYENRYQGAGISTTSQIATLGAGPQLTLGSGGFRIYGFATVGGAWFFTGITEAGCGCSTGDVEITGDLTTSTSAGGGVLLFLSTGRTPIAIDIGARGARHDNVRYIPVDGFTRNSDGSLTANYVSTPVIMRVLQVGVSVGIR